MLLPLVSILVLMEVILQGSTRQVSHPATLGFNPCFNGSHSSSGSAVEYFTFFIIVSILVLMEVILQVWLYSCIEMIIMVSILVLMEVILQADKCIIGIIISYLFQSLF